MLKKLFARPSEGMEREPKEWDDDPVARKTEWSPKKAGGASFRTHRLETPSVTRMEFRLTLGAKLFCWLFVGMGGGIPLVIISRTMQAGTDFMSILPVPCIGIVFVGVGLGMLHFMGKPRVFDKASGRYWKGEKDPNRTGPQLEAEDSLALSDIYALQLLSEYVRGDKSSYYSHELNLVLENGRRVNVIDHGKLTSLREDAGTLAGFLAVPVWDAT
jgi:hypothetical protein